MKFKQVIGAFLGLITVAFSAPSSAAMVENTHYMYSGGVLRNYLVDKPTSCTSNCPMVIDIHGYTSDASSEKLSSGQLQMGDANGYIVAYPNGLQNSWNAGSGTYGSCCGYAVSARIDDVGFIKAMIAKIKTDYPMVDPKRIYVTGISNGCALSQRLAAEASDVIAAASCTSLYLLTNTTALKRPIAVTEVHGLQDSIVSYNKSTSWTGAQNNFKRWASMNGCVGTPTKTALTASSYVEEYATCSSGVKVKLYSIKSDHITYNNTDGIDVARIMWDNLKNFTLP